MSRITKLAFLPFTLLTLATCSTGPDSSIPTATIVTDTLGTKFSASCSSSICALTVQDPSIKPLSCDAAYGTDTFVMLWSRVLTIHVMNIPSSGPAQLSVAEPGHPVACTTTDADCSLWNATVGQISYQFTCLNGICQDRDKSITQSDAITLCQADILWPSACPYITSLPFASRLAEIGASCGSGTQCAGVPADCWQPTASAAGGIPAVDSGALDTGGALDTM
jgi:hypothetical protein